MLVFWLFLCLSSVEIGFARLAPLSPVYQWKYFDFKWKSPKHKAQAIASGDYDYRKGVIIDVDRTRDSRTLVTLVRDKGVPSSLNVVTNQRGPGGPLLKPYPNWSWANRKNCTGITSVFRIAIDHCDRLWVLDTGLIGENEVCPAKLLVFDTLNDKLIKQVVIPEKVAKNPYTKRGLLITPVVQAIGGRCTETYVYIADVVGDGLIIYNGKTFWRLQSSLFGPNKSASNIAVDKENFYLEDGILGMALAPGYNYTSRMLFFRSLSSFDLNTVTTDDLRNSKTRAVKYLKAQNMLPSQAAGMAFSTSGILFFGLPRQTAVGCWNYNRPAKKRNIFIVARDRKHLQFISGVKTVPRYVTGYDEELWLVSNRFQKVMSGSMNFTEVNFRVLQGNVDELIAGTICQPSIDLSVDGTSEMLYSAPTS
ncbi:hypothetical protein KM043_011180 [Ampulex compressa]|nr:hypothetical protein KM043_011180 [Ampulex compressa]